jgi:hypothetical protein
MLTAAVLAGCMLGCATPKPTLTTATGTVCSCTKSEIVLTEGNYYWVIQRTPTTRVISGTCSKGSTVTVEYSPPDAQRKEGRVRRLARRNRVEDGEATREEKAEFRNDARTGDLTSSSERPIRQTKLVGHPLSARQERDK